MTKKNTTLTDAETASAVDRLAAQLYAAATIQTRDGLKPAASRVPSSEHWEGLRRTAALRLAHTQFLIDQLGPGYTREQQARYQAETPWDARSIGLCGDGPAFGLGAVSREAVRHVEQHQARHANGANMVAAA